MDRPVVPFGRPRPERADAARNREHLLQVAREMIEELGAEKVTMDGLADRAGLGKGTVFRRFGTRAGIFAALLDAEEKIFQQAAMSGPPPLGPGAAPIDRLIAYGQARATFLVDHLAVVRAAVDRNNPIPSGVPSLTRLHIHMLLAQARPPVADLEVLALQLTAALEGPFLLYLSTAGPLDDAAATALSDGWKSLIDAVCRP
ncbi:helix-turn-helix domain-containing protein [Actinocorallia longicatena]|uniref:TetR/AcrR family transcriptional regulator n=1 Tax=Actinocorallia longicatena TaxID=111803 RepID=A0ABP6Q1Q1_9ACTN